MKSPIILAKYVARNFLFSIALAAFGLIAISSLIDLMELLRRSAKYQNVPLAIILQMLVLRIPGILEKLMPYAVLIGSMLALTRLTRTNELIVARAAGISVWQFLAPALAVVMTLGIVMVTLFNPLSAVLLLRFEHLEARYIDNRSSLLSISSSGLWIRQMEEDPTTNVSEYLINAARIVPQEMRMNKVMIFSFDKNGRFVERFDAEQASLEQGMLALSDVTRSVQGKPPEKIIRLLLPTSLTMEYIQNSFAPPESMSFWQLPGFIFMLEQAGFSALRHRLYYQSLLAVPFLMAGMVWVAAVFSMRPSRRGKAGIMASGGILTGFLLYFLTDLVHALGAAGTLPIILSAWTPAVVMLMFGAVLLLHIEDG